MIVNFVHYEIQLYVLLYIVLYTIITGVFLLLLYNISINTQYVLQYYQYYSHHSLYFIYIVCATLLVIAGIPPFSFFFIKVIYCKYILLYANFIYFIYFIYIILLMLYFYLKFIQLFFPKNILYKLNNSIKIYNTHKINKLALLLVYLMLLFCIYYNDLSLALNYIFN